MTNGSTDTKESLWMQASPSRRAFLQKAGWGLAAIIRSECLFTRLAQGAPSDTPGLVKIVRFSDTGQRLNAVLTPRIVKSDEDWRKQLTPNEFDVTRRADTELAFTGKYWNLHDSGLYRCVCCGNALFSSKAKYDSGTGWPSFTAAIAPENVREVRDTSLGITRTAVACAGCDAHLGHVFNDGPAPTYRRYCMNSVSLRFIQNAG